MDKPINKSIFDKAWNQNQHGGGVGFWRGNEPVILTTMERDVGWNMYNHAVDQVRKNKKTNPARPQHIMVHWRYATHGARQRSNNHPFFVPVDNGIILGHNGQTKHEGIEMPAGWSDTRTFAEKWIPEKAPKLLREEEDIKKVIGQIGGSRLALLTPWTPRLFNFPEQNKEEYKEFGSFSNFLFDPLYKPVVQQNQPNQFWSNRTTVQGKRCYREWKHNNDEDRERFSTPGGPGSGKGKMYKYMSPNMVHRAMSFAVKTNMTFSGTVMMFKELFNDYPSHMQMQDFAEVFGQFLDAASAEAGDVTVNHPLALCDSEHPETPEEMLSIWMKFNGYEKPGQPSLSDEEKKELEKALREEQEEAEKKIDQFVEGQMKLQQQEENWRIEDDFRDEGPEEPKEEVPLNLGYGQDTSADLVRAFKD